MKTIDISKYEEIERQSNYYEEQFNKLEQENNILKAFIKAHHPEIAKINDITLDVVVRATDERLQQENKQLKEQLAEQIDYKDEYYHYWQETKKENELLKKALELACEKFIRDEVGMLTDTELYDYFIEQAKESIK